MAEQTCFSRSFLILLKLSEPPNCFCFFLSATNTCPCQAAYCNASVQDKIDHKI